MDMKDLGSKIALKRKDLGMTQTEFADKLSVTRQTVSRWEAGSVMPDIDKISDIAEILDVSCDYLLKDDHPAENAGGAERFVDKGVSRLLLGLTGKKVKLTFFEDEVDIDLYDTVCTVIEFEGNWMKIQAKTKKETIEKLIPVSSVRSIEEIKED